MQGGLHRGLELHRGLRRGCGLHDQVQWGRYAYLRSGLRVYGPVRRQDQVTRGAAGPVAIG
jgi:hypothetical protein